MPTIAALSIYVHDLKKAEDFYTSILAFKIKSRPAPVLTELEHEGVALVLCQAEERAPGAYGKHSGVVIGLASDDVAKRAEKLSSANVPLVVAKPQEFPGGRFIAVTDPSGNVIELLEFASG